MIYFLIGILFFVGCIFGTLLLRKKHQPSDVPMSPSTSEVSWTPDLAVPSKSASFAKAMLGWLPLLSSKSKDLQAWERALIESDMGPRLTAQILSELQSSSADPLSFFKARLLSLIEGAESRDPPWIKKNPWVVYLIGVNGVGKTTSLVKLAHFFGSQNLSVGVIAADTFRKAAVEQLERGVQKIGAEFFTLKGAEGSEGADPSAVIFDGLRKFKDKNIVLVDTSGRLHTKVNLMDELKKMKRVADKSLPGTPHDLWLVMDSTLGQNTVPQARAFHEAVGLTGMILTKMDGLSRGGTVFQLFQELRLPIWFLGVGEGISDLKPFKSVQFVEDLFDHRSSSS